VSIRTLKRSNRRGFTLIELLVVVLILSILMAVALPLYLSAVADSQRKVCRANMQTIANAVQAARVKTDAADYTTWIGAPPTGWSGASGVLPDLSAVPVCPSAGTYSIAQGATPGGSNTTFMVQCSYTTGTPHGTFQPGVDSN
jgi:prepilin-type N-terminal cleavage/methylation domain-containing protein